MQSIVYEARCSNGKLIHILFGVEPNLIIGYMTLRQLYPQYEPVRIRFAQMGGSFCNHWVDVGELRFPEGLSIPSEMFLPPQTTAAKTSPVFAF